MPIWAHFHPASSHCTVWHGHTGSHFAHRAMNVRCIDEPPLELMGRRWIAFAGVLVGTNHLRRDLKCNAIIVMPNVSPHQPECCRPSVQQWVPNWGPFFASMGDGGSAMDIMVKAENWWLFIIKWVHKLLSGHSCSRTNDGFKTRIMEWGIPQ